MQRPTSWNKYDFCILAFSILCAFLCCCCCCCLAWRLGSARFFLCFFLLLFCISYFWQGYQLLVDGTQNESSMWITVCKVSHFIYTTYIMCIIFILYFYYSVWSIKWKPFFFSSSFAVCSLVVFYFVLLMLNIIVLIHDGRLKGYLISYNKYSGFFGYSTGI